MDAKHPGFSENVIAADGQLHRFINVYVNDEDVRYLQSLETEVIGRRHRLDPAGRRRRLECVLRGHRRDDREHPARRCRGSPRGPPGRRLYAKLEGQNPTGSVKDRIAGR